MMVTKIFQFGPREAEIMGFKEGRGLISMFSQRDWVDLFKLNFLFSLLVISTKFLCTIES